MLQSRAESRRRTWTVWLSSLGVLLLLLWSQTETLRYFANFLKDRNDFSVGTCDVVVGREWIDFPGPEHGGLYLAKWRPFRVPEEGRYIVLLSVTDPKVSAQLERVGRPTPIGSLRAYTSTIEDAKYVQLFVPDCNALLVSARPESFEGIQFFPHANL